jgi:acyl-CoA thioesterase YciA
VAGVPPAELWMGTADTAASTVNLCYSSRRMDDVDQPKGELVIQTIAMPKDTNPNGDIFGGWLTSQMDLGSSILAAKIAQARVVTVAMEGMSFLEPVQVGDTVACYAWVERIGRTSMVIPVEVWVRRYMHGKQMRVTRGVFTHVAVDDSGRPIPVKREAP